MRQGMAKKLRAKGQVGTLPFSWNRKLLPGELLATGSPFGGRLAFAGGSGLMSTGKVYKQLSGSLAG